MIVCPTTNRENPIAVSRQPTNTLIRILNTNLYNALIDNGSVAINTGGGAQQAFTRALQPVPIEKMLHTYTYR